MGFQRSLSGISLRSFLLGQVIAICICLSILLAKLNITLWRLPAFLAALGIFHFLEFWMTARYNPSEATVNSFLFTSNGVVWQFLSAAAVAECVATRTLLSQRYADTVAFIFGNDSIRGIVGILLTVGSQAIRSLAMAQAGTSFNHTIQGDLRQGHVLITTGLYRFSRHPSYFGFFWWSIGTQLILGNVLCLTVNITVLWCLLYLRIECQYLCPSTMTRLLSTRFLIQEPDEEETLVELFRQDYIRYRESTPVLIPGIPW